MCKHAHKISTRNNEAMHWQNLFWPGSRSHSHLRYCPGSCIQLGTGTLTITYFKMVKKVCKKGFFCGSRCKTFALNLHFLYSSFTIICDRNVFVLPRFILSLWLEAFLCSFYCRIENSRNWRKPMPNAWIAWKVPRPITKFSKTNSSFTKMKIGTCNKFLPNSKLVN